MEVLRELRLEGCLGTRGTRLDVYSMSEDSRNIVAMLQQLRNLCEEIHLLLGTADGQIQEIDNGWKAMNKNVFYGLSYMLSKSPRQSPRHWIPQDFARFYENDNLGHIRAFVSVILD